MRTFMQGYQLPPNKDSPSFSSTYSAQRRPFVSFTGTDVRRRGNPEPYTGTIPSTRESGTEKIGAGRPGMQREREGGNRHIFQLTLTSLSRLFPIFNLQRLKTEMRE